MKTIAFFPEASYGSALNCVGIAQQLRKRGARPVFICHPGFNGVFENYGFAEYQLHASKVEPGAAQDWQGFIERHRDSFRLSPLDQIDAYVVPTWEAIVQSAIDIEEPLRHLLARLKPDAIVVDNTIAFPAVLNAGVPWVRVVSCAETELPDPQVPPFLSGCDSKDRPGWERFRSRYLPAIAPVHERFSAFLQSCGIAPYEPGEFLAPSPWLNLLLSPAAVRYRRRHALKPPQFIYLDGCVRDEASWRLPHFAAHEDGALVCVSFGSLGAMDVPLLQRMIDVCAQLPYRFIVNVGTWRASYEATPDNVFLASWLPQPSVVRRSQLFIHHGGNNSFCEALYFGVPSLIMPYCWDGHDNAQRAVETQVGDRLSRYDWDETDLKSAIVRLLEDTEMHQRLRAGATRMQAADGTGVAAQAILDLL